MWRTRRFDPLTVVERAYDLRSPDGAWLAGVIDAARPGVPGDFVGGIVFGARGAARHVVAEVRDPREPLEARRIIRETLITLPDPVVSELFGPAPFVGASNAHPRIGASLETRLDHDGFGTSVGFSVGDGRGGGLAIGSFAPTGTTITGPLRRMWFRTVAHVGAALRLRARLAHATQEPVAVFAQNGRHVHLDPSIAESGRRHALLDAIERMRAARGSMRKLDPDGALGLFRALAAGEYTVVDWVDSDGKRMLLVHHNPLPLRSPRALTSREVQVAELMLEGRSNSEIGYLLGIGTGTVSRIARDVLRKLGRARRDDLPRLFERGADVGRLLDDADAYVVAAPPSDPRVWSRLTDAERHVVQLALGGSSNDDIAQARGVSRRTVANQLASVYARLGVRGRVELGGLLGEPAPDRVRGG